MLDPKMNLLIARDVLVGDDERVNHVYVNYNGEILFHDVVSNRVTFYRLLKLPHQLTKDECLEILEYRFGKYYPNVHVSLADIAIHGKFIEPCDP